MKLARYVGGGQIAIVDEPAPECPAGGLLIKTEASGLCSGELMDWYMERKVPHVLGHEVTGIVVESKDVRFPLGSRAFVHHHAPCMRCEWCRRKLYVHCEQWKRTKLVLGGMAEFYAVSPDNLSDSFLVDDLRPIDAALIEPLGCVVKSIRRSGIVDARLTPLFSGGEIGESESCEDKPGEGGPGHEPQVAVVGLGSLGIMHLQLAPNSVGYDLNEERIRHAQSLGLEARLPDNRKKADAVFVCPGNKPALDLAIELANPGATIIVFAPFPPEGEVPVDLNRLYFNDIRLVTTYSCGPNDTTLAQAILRSGRIRAEQVVSDFIAIDDLPQAYQQMKRGEILKPMVVFAS